MIPYSLTSKIGSLIVSYTGTNHSWGYMDRHVVLSDVKDESISSRVANYIPVHFNNTVRLPSQEEDKVGSEKWLLVTLCRRGGHIRGKIEWEHTQALNAFSSSTSRIDLGRPTCSSSMNASSWPPPSSNAALCFSKWEEWFSGPTIVTMIT